MDEFGGNASESREGRRDKARWRRCVRACVSARAPLHRSTCTVSLLHPSRYGRPLTRSRPVSFLFLARWLPVPFSYWLSCPLVFLSLDSFYDSGPISWLAIGFTLLYCVLTLLRHCRLFCSFPLVFSNSEFWVRFLTGTTHFTCKFSHSSAHSRAFVEKKMKIFSHVFLVNYCTVPVYILKCN